MYIVLCYDVGVERVGRVHKTAKKYLRPVQKSVLEGNMTESELERMKRELAELIDPEHDVATIYFCAFAGNMMKAQIGKPRDASLNIV